MFGLSLFRRTSSPVTFNLAAYHSPHSLTWSWILALVRQPVMWPRPYAMRNSVGFGAGFGQLIGFYAYRNNDGWQWSISFLWVALNWSRQRPMWFRNMVQRAWDEKFEADREAARLREKLYSPPPVGRAPAGVPLH